MVSPTRLHAELLGLLRQHSRFADQRHLVLLGADGGSVSAELVIALQKRVDWRLEEFSEITLLADRGFPSTELLGWIVAKPCWRYVMRLRVDTWIHGTAAP